MQKQRRRCFASASPRSSASWSPRADFDAVIDGIAGVVLTHLSGIAARCSNDLMVRRKIDAVVYEVRKEMAKVALEMADKNGKPPLEQQAAH
jgi:hypothetical protein